MSATVATRIIDRCPVAQSGHRAPVERLIFAHGTASVAMALPWPALLVVTWSSTHSHVWLGVAGGARMAPYVALSWLAGALGDRVPRIRLLRASMWARAGLLMVAALLVEMGHGLAAVFATTLVMATGTPAYPALVAEMPRIAGARTEQATRWLVTFEISAFVVGSAFGGLAIGLLGVDASMWLGAALALAASMMLVGIRIDRNRSEGMVTSDRGRTGLVLRSGSARRAIAAVAVINAIGGAVAVALLPMAAACLGWRQRRVRVGHRGTGVRCARSALAAALRAERAQGSAVVRTAPCRCGGYANGSLGDGGSRGPRSQRHRFRVSDDIGHPAQRARHRPRLRARPGRHRHDVGRVGRHQLCSVAGESARPTRVLRPVCMRGDRCHRLAGRR
jgi:MFS family permease